MKITIAKTAGFCMGVRRAVEIALDQANSKNEPICTFGPLIHNPQVLSLLEEKGIPVLDEIPEKGTGTVLIRAHGVPPEAFEKLKKAGFTIVDATCPRVIKVQRIIRKYAEKGYSSIIIGDDDHPEVIGLNGYAEGRGYIVNSLPELEALPSFEKAIVVAQTTQNTKLYDQIKKWVESNNPHYEFFNTICDSTEKRQSEILNLAKTSDAVVIVGGKNSGNTQRLAELAIQAGKQAWHIESEEELDMDQLANAESITISAGASTPNWIINRVHNYLGTRLMGRRHPYRKKLYDIQQLLLRTNLYLAFGAGSLCYACSKLQNIKHGFLPAIVSMTYVLSMHILNHLTAIRPARYNEPERAEFYNRYKKEMTALALSTGAIGLFLVYWMGIVPLVLLIIMSLMGLSYDLNLFPEKNKYRKISDIPGSKTFLIAIAWGVVTALLPAFSPREPFSLATVPAFLLSTGIVFARTVFHDILDMQGDRIVGQKTLPLLLGTKKTIDLLKKILIGLLIILPVSSAAGLISDLGYWLSLFPVTMMGLLFMYERGKGFYGLRLEFLLETLLVLTGFIALIWVFFN